MARSKFLTTVMLVASLVLVSVGAAVSASPALAQEPVKVTITARAVVGGVNHNLALWLTTFAIPTFEEMMAAQGTPVDVEFVEFGGGDEQLK